MKIGVLRIEIHIAGARSLKEKRRVLRSLKDRLFNEFNVSVAEVDEQDKWQLAVLGIATVGTDRRFVESVLDKVLEFIYRNPAYVANCTEREIF